MSRLCVISSCKTNSLPFANRTTTNVHTLIQTRSNKKVINRFFATAEAHHQIQDLIPSVRFLLLKHHLNPTQIKGTGRKGRIMKHDVLSFLSNLQAAQSAPSTQPKTVQHTTPIGVGGRPTLQVQSTPIQVGKAVKLETPRSIGRRGNSYEDEPNNNIRKVTAKRLTLSKGTIPHEYLTEEIKIDNLLKMRQNLNTTGKVKLSVNDFIIRACGLALRSVPQVNASFDEKTQEPKLLNTVDISVAVATDKGLITPIIKNADSKNLTAISESMSDLATRARAGKLRPEEFQGGSFSISNLGMFGIEEFSAVINPPQAAILAVGAGRIMCVPSKSVGKKTVLPDDSGKPSVVNSVKVTLSFDGRVIDEVEASKFLEKVSQYLKNPSVLV